MILLYQYIAKLIFYLNRAREYKRIVRVKGTREFVIHATQKKKSKRKKNYYINLKYYERIERFFLYFYSLLLDFRVFLIV